MIWALGRARGETLAIMGPSGCGKSTLLHVLGGLDQPTAGTVNLAGHQLDKMSEKALACMRREEIGFVFQDFHLMDELTVVENVELPLLLAGCSPKAARTRAIEVLERLGLENRTTFLPAALSGRQRQRVAVARAISNEPAVLFADEHRPGYRGMTGRLLLLLRLAVRDLRHRRVEGLLVVLVLATATTTLTVGRCLDGTTGDPYEATRKATSGPDVVAQLVPPPPTWTSPT